MPIQYPPSQVWPPCPFDTAAKEMEVHDAWYVGDPTALAAAYNAGTTTRPGSPGLVGRLRGWFWGTPPETVGKTTRLHVPVPADLATASADLLFSEPPQVVFPVDDEDVPAEPVEGAEPSAVARPKHPAQDRLTELMDSDATHATLLEAAEVCAAIGGAYLRITWDAAVVPDRPILGAFGGDRAIPEFRYGILTAVTFWTRYTDDNRSSVVWRHLERHEPGRIFHALYEGTADYLGRPVPLTDRPETAWAADVVDAEGGVNTGATRLTAVYVPNVLPQRRWRKTPGLQHLGRSDFDGVEGLFDALDEAWSSWMRDIHLGKARVFVEEAALDFDAPGDGATFDTEREIFSPVNFGGSGKTEAPLVPYQPNIRWQEHQATVTALIRQVLQSAGYSPSSLGLEGDGVATATEVTSRERLSDRTRDKKARYWSAALAQLAVTMLEVDRYVFGGGVPVDPHELPDVVFPETSQPDTEAMARTVQALRGVQAMSIETAVSTAHPEWDKPQVRDEVARILAEQTATAAPDPFTFRGFPTTTGEPEPAADEAPEPETPAAA